ncbi:GntR family transcriptional regulator [Novosphingobium kaempferiae]|uniref:GntR family transcriptional regulator n=1 Tax=Novosphingobium kaempferiae TaxID=2896849 RepID=UPI001E2B936F|nr:GntR family transcriptional regulator [Novosphingobium kaempferiae]
MNAGATAERVLDALRLRIMENGFRPGERLDAAAIGRQLAASITPVRDALNRLTGEGLVEARHSGGFHLPALDEPCLQDYYHWAQQLLTLAIASWPPGGRTALGRAGTMGDGFVHSPDPSDAAERTSRLFTAIARASPNAFHAEAIERLNVHLHGVRRIEAEVLGDPQDELEPWMSAIEAGDRAALRRLVASYHRRRIRSAAAIVRALYRQA